MSVGITCTNSDIKANCIDYGTKAQLDEIRRNTPANQDLLVLLQKPEENMGNRTDALTVYRADRLKVDGFKGLPAKGTVLPVAFVAESHGTYSSQGYSSSYSGTVLEAQPAQSPRSAVNIGLRKLLGTTGAAAKNFVNIKDSDSPGCHVGALAGAAITVGGVAIGTLAPKVLGEATRAGGAKIGAAVGLTGIALGLGAGLVWDLSAAVFEIGHASHERYLGRR